MEELTDAEVDELFKSLVDESTFWCFLGAWHIMEVKLDEYYAKAIEIESDFV